MKFIGDKVKFLYLNHAWITFLVFKWFMTFNKPIVAYKTVEFHLPSKACSGCS